MGIKAYNANWRVVVHADYNQFMNDEQAREDERRNAFDLERQIKRHCDGWAQVEVAYDRVQECEHCGTPWTEGDSPHNGGCCPADTDVLEATGS